MKLRKTINSIASFSDFHLGLRNGSREFQGDENQALEFINYLTNEYDLVLALGDFYGALENKGKIEEIRKRYPRLSQKVESLEYKIWGNHDFKLRKSYRHDPWQASYVNLFNGKRFFALHGYQFDRFNKNPRQGIGTRLAQGHSFWENRLKNNFQKMRKRYRIPEQVTSYIQLIRILTFERNIKKFAEHFGIDIILTGHMHNPSVKRFTGGQVYINDGSCVKEYTYSHILPYDDIFEVRRWDPDTGETSIVSTMERIKYSPWIGSLTEGSLFF